MRIARSDGVAHLHNLPLFFPIEHGALIQAVVFPVEASFSPRCTQTSQIGASGGRCRAPHYPVELVEREVERHYRTVRLSKRVRERVWEDVRRDAAERGLVIEREAERHRQRLRTLQGNQARLVQLAYRGLVTDEVLADEQHRLEDEQHEAQRLLAATELHAADIDQRLDEALALTETPHAAYIASTPLERRLLNQAFFERLLIGEDSEVQGATLAPVYASLSAWHEPFGQAAPNTAISDDAGPQAANPGPLSGDQGLPLVPMVELGGLEPPTSWVRSRRYPN